MNALITWVDSFFLVYTLCILIRILMSWITVAPVRRWSRAFVGFIHETTDWYLNIFRRVIPPVGPLDLSPVVALIVLVILNRFAIRILESV